MPALMRENFQSAGSAKKFAKPRCAQQFLREIYC